MKPKIGIRPTIDGRWGGVRESLEEKTMAMAKAAKELIEKNVHYQDGTSVECVISPCTIGGGAEAAKCAEYFSTQNVCASLAVTPCWCYGSETMDLSGDTVKAVWGFNGTERPGAVYLAAVMAAFAQRGLPAFSMYGHDVQDIDDNTVPDDVAEKMIRWAKGAIAVGQMKDKAYVNLGGVAMGIAGSYCDMPFILTYVLPLKSEVFTRELWEMMTECSIVFPNGVGVMEWKVPCCAEIGIATGKLMEQYDAVIWAHHGLVCSGETLDMAFGVMHTIEKAAEMLVNVMQLGGKRQTITPSDFKEIAHDFNLNFDEKFLYEK